MEQSSTIRKAMKNANLTAVITAAIVFLLLALLVVFSIKPIYNHFAGPFDVTAEELTSYKGPEDTLRTNVITHPDIALDTYFYFYEEQEDGSEKVIHSYYALMFDERLLLAKYPGAGKGDILDPGPVTGKIIKLTDTENTEVLDSLIAEYPNLKDAFLPYMLDTTASGESVWSTIIGIVALALIAIWCLLNLLRRSINPAKHPVTREISRYGDWNQLAHEIDSQMAEPHETHGGIFHLTRDWLVYQTKNRFDAVPYRDLIWQHMFQVTYRSFGIVTGKIYTLMVYDRYGKTKSLLYGKDSGAVTDLTNKLQKLAPWAYTGYSAEMENTWNQEREKMIAIVDARKQAIENHLAEVHKMPTDTDGLLENDYPEPNPDQVGELNLNATPSDSEAGS